MTQDCVDAQNTYNATLQGVEKYVAAAQQTQQAQTTSNNTISSLAQALSGVNQAGGASSASVGQQQYTGAPTGYTGQSMGYGTQAYAGQSTYMPQSSTGMFNAFGAQQGNFGVSGIGQSNFRGTF